MGEGFDLVVVGGGAAGLAAAAYAAACGAKVALLEKTAQWGGTSALSGGMVWAPGNAHLAPAEREGDLEAAERYLEAVCGPEGRERRAAFLRAAPAALAALEARGLISFRLVPVYPDYYPEKPGARSGGRVLEPEPFEGRRLGPDFFHLRPPLPDFAPLGGMMIAREELPSFRRALRCGVPSPLVLRRLAAQFRARLAYPRGTRLVLGNALCAWLLAAARAHGVTLLLNTPALGLWREGRRVTGVRSAAGLLPARAGVVLASGGFSHDPVRRAALLPEGGRPFSAAAPGASGDGLRFAEEVGGALAVPAAGAAFWSPISRYVRPDGREAYFPHTVTDRAKPGVIAVDAQGARFVNEALSYHEFGQAMLRHEAARRATYLIADDAALSRYGFGPVLPGRFGLRRFQASGAVISAPTREALARRLGLPVEAFLATLEAFNRAAARGEDPVWGRGGDAYQRYLGDPDWRPNPCLAPLATPPFHALRLYPADLGTAAGLLTDAAGRVLDPEGAVIPGLFACGNDMASVMGGAYPGPGITLGPALTFAVRAVEAALG
jgi:glycine/D-amino acid oxidase-like deaminating enzyme